MPVGTNATVKALTPDEIARDGRLDHPRQHVPPVPAARRGPDRAARRPAPVHGLGSARSSPTRAASRSSRSATCGSSTRTASRSAATSTARPTGSRPRSRSPRRRRSGSDIAVAFDQPVFPTLAAGRRRRRDRAHASLGRAVARGAHARGPGALRDRPGRPRPGPAGGLDPVHREPAVRRHLPRRARRRRDARPSATRRSTSRCRSSTTTRGRAT